MTAVGDEFKFSATAFAVFGYFGPFGGPYSASDWAKHLRDGKESGTTDLGNWAIYAIQVIWLLERLAAGLGMWFFLLTDWSHVNFFIAIWALFFFYVLMDWYCWPGLYFYPVKQRNYFFVAGTYFLGWASLVVSWILAVVQRAHNTPGFFWTYFSLSVLSSFLAAGLAVLLIYAHRSSEGFFGGFFGSAPNFRAGRK